MSKRKTRHAKAPPKPDAEKVAAADATGPAGTEGEGSGESAMAGGAPVEAVGQTTASDGARHDNPADQGTGEISGVKEGEGDGGRQDEATDAADAGDRAGAQGQPDPAHEEARGQADAAAPPAAANGEPPANVMDVNVLAAAAAASMAFGTHESDGTTMPRLDISWLTPETPMAPAAECAGRFLRRHPGSKPETVALHLKMQKHCPRAPAPDSREAVAWTVFATALSALDAHDAAQKAKAEEAKPRRPMGARLEDQTWAPPDERPLTEIGRRAQRQMSKQAKKGKGR